MDNDLKNALKVLKAGGIILYPTDTVWGIGCDATNPDAVDKVYGLKKREDSKSLIALVASLEMLKDWVEDLNPEIAQELIDSERPTTVIYESPKGFAQNMLASDNSVGIRVTGETFSKELCRLFGKPIVSTSANISGSPTPADFASIDEEIKEGVDYIATHGRFYKPGKPSRIIKLKGREIDIIRG